MGVTRYLCWFTIHQCWASPELSVEGQKPVLDQCDLQEVDPYIKDSRMQLLAPYLHVPRGFPGHKVRQELEEEDQCLLAAAVVAK